MDYIFSRAHSFQISNPWFLSHLYLNSLDWVKCQVTMSTVHMSWYCIWMICSQGSLKGESVVAAILSSRMEQSYCTSGFFRFQARFLTSSAPILTITHYLRVCFTQRVTLYAPPAVTSMSLRHVKGGHFQKLKISSKLRWLPLHIWYQIKGPIIIVHLKVHTVKLKCVDYKILKKKKKMICLF